VCWVDEGEGTTPTISIDGSLYFKLSPRNPPRQNLLRLALQIYFLSCSDPEIKFRPRGQCFAGEFVIRCKRMLLCTCQMENTNLWRDAGSGIHLLRAKLSKLVMNVVPKYSRAEGKIIVILARFIPVVDIITMKMSCYTCELDRNR
jgi:hypothetical protein